MTPNLVLEKLAIDHANHVSDPEWECWHKRQGSFKSGYTRAIADVVEWLKEGSAHPESSSCSAGECDICDKEYVAGLVENKFLKGENENS